jgi:hypothetical protein
VSTTVAQIAEPADWQSLTRIAADVSRALKGAGRAGAHPALA